MTTTTKIATPTTNIMMIGITIFNPGKGADWQVFEIVTNKEYVFNSASGFRHFCPFTKEM